MSGESPCVPLSEDSFANGLPRHCTLHGRIISLKQDPEYLHYRVAWPKSKTTPPPPPATALALSTTTTPSPDDTEALLKSYFNLHHSLTTLYSNWSASDPNFRARAPSFTGIRILNQPAWEALVAFICSSNNNIARISQMVANLCRHYGEFLGDLQVDGSDTPMHDFPTPAALAVPGVEEHLRELGFGYRARYIASTAKLVAQERPAAWLAGLRNPASTAWGPSQPQLNGDEKDTEKPTYKRAHEQLLQLTGVGPKVADCVCLMGLGWLESVPVDTHVWQIAMRDYNFGGKSKNKTLTKAMYEAVGDHFRDLWGDEAGWAHSVLFTADLKTFAGRGVKKEQSVETNKVKIEREDVAGLMTPESTPVGTPMKRKRAVKTDQPSGSTLLTSSYAELRKWR